MLFSTIARRSGVQQVETNYQLLPPEFFTIVCKFIPLFLIKLQTNHYFIRFRTDTAKFMSVQWLFCKTSKYCLPAAADELMNVGVTHHELKFSWFWFPLFDFFFKSPLWTCMTLINTFVRVPLLLRHHLYSCERRRDAVLVILVSSYRHGPLDE